MKNWQQTTLDETADLLTGFPFKSSNYTEDESGVALVRGDNVVQGRFRWDDVKRWPKDETAKLSNYFLQAGDVILAMDRPWIDAGLKYACVADEDLPCLLVQRVTRLRARNGLNQGFLRYVIGSKEFTNYVLAVQTGTAVPHISSGQIKQFQFQCPPSSEQQAIASVLGSLDDKIELNRRMNKTLEALAQCLFKSWFVDTTQSALRKGWREAPFEEAFGIPLRNGLTRPKAVRGSGVRMVNMGELFAHRRIGNIEMDRVPLSGEELEKSQLAVGDLLFARQSLTLEGAGQCSIVVGASEPRTFEGHLIRCRLHRQRANHWFFFHYFLSALGRSRITTIVEQVAASGIRASDLARLSVLMPPPELQHQFGNLVNSFEERIAINNEESRTLAALRDALLPKLLSGELRLPTAAKLVEATA